MAFKMRGFSPFTKKTGAVEAGGADENIKQQLLDQLSAMEDPMESNRGKAIARRLMDEFGMTGDQLDAIIGPQQ
jgi:hypothetical protein